MTQVGLTSQERYQQKFERLIDFIYQHLDTPLDQMTLSEVACISPYHLHRIYHSVYGESLAATVKRLRLHYAADRLANTELPVKEVAACSGYTSLQSFTRAFSDSYGMPPARYRKEGSHQQFKLEYPHRAAQEHTMHEVRIETIQPINLMGMSHTGSYMDIGQAFEKLFGWLGMKGLLGPDMRCIGIYFDDPGSVPEAELRSMATASFCDMSKVEVEKPFEENQVPGGEYAVLRFKGPYSDMHSAYQWFYGQWLPESGREAADQPVFEEYLNNPREVAPTELLTDIYLPLKAL